MSGILFALSAGAGWAVGAVLARVGLQQIRPSIGTFLSIVASFIVAVAAALIFEFRAFTSLPLQAILYFALAGILSQGAGRYLNFSGIKRLGAARNAPLTATAPLFATIMAVVFLDETVTALILGGILLLVTGVYLLTSGKPIVSGAKKWEYVFPIGAAACWGGSGVFIKAGVSNLAIPPLAGVPVALFFALLILALPARKDFNISLAGNRRSIGLLMLSGVASSLAVIAQYFALSRLPVVIAAPLWSTSPLITILLAHLFLQRLEKITGRVVIGAFLVVIGVVLIIVGRP
jgi:drug/metabolite transporter (DMT)-like permease